MPIIGQFSRDASGFIGRIDSFTLFHDVLLLPVEPSEAENAPDYRVHTSNDVRADGGPEIGPEVGAAWKRTGERAGEYFAVTIDDPCLTQPIRANLFRDDDAGTAWSLHWTRPPAGERKG